jgi:hypothetical protein
MTNENDSNAPSANPQGQPPRQPPVVPPNIEKKHETTYSNPDPTPLWKIWLEIGAVAVGIIVASIYYGQLVVMRGQLGEIIKQYPEIKKTADAANTTLVEGRTTSAEQLQKLDAYVTQAEKANAIAIAANRPWIGYVPRQSSDPEESYFEFITDKQGAFEYVLYDWRVKNAGKRPASVERIRTTGNWGNSCTENPDYNFIPPNAVQSPFGTKQWSRTFIVPEAVIGSRFTTQIPGDQWASIKALPPKSYFCIYSLIDYRDVDYPDAVHHTRDCRMLITMPPRGDFGFVECNNRYAQAD